MLKPPFLAPPLCIDPGYAAPAPATTVVVAAAGPALSTQPVTVTCPHCRANVQTRVNYETGLLTWLAVGACLLVG